MDDHERQIIDDLFARLRQAEAAAGARDAEAEALIRRHVADQPAAPYYMAQAIVVQQEALARGRERIEELERQLAARRSGGFLTGLFGGDETSTSAPPTSARAGGPWRGQQPGAGGGFLAGAMQTALGVAGGFLVADAISGLFAADDAAAAETFAADEANAPDDRQLGAGDDPGWGNDGGDFDFDAS